MEKDAYADVRVSLMYAEGALDEHFDEKALFWALALAMDIDRANGGKLLGDDLRGAAKFKMNELYNRYINPV